MLPLWLLPLDWLQQDSVVRVGEEPDGLPALPAPDLLLRHHHAVEGGREEAVGKDLQLVANVHLEINCFLKKSANIMLF